MSSNSSIEWTNSTWNPILGCTRVSAGCDSCYAIRQSHRMAGNPNAAIAAANAGLTRIRGEGLDWTGTVRCLPERLTVPLCWKKPRRIFVNSLSDLFHHSVPFEFIDQVFAVMALCPQHTFQILTKRPERMAEYMNTPARMDAIRAETLSKPKFPLDALPIAPGSYITNGSGYGSQEHRVDVYHHPVKGLSVFAEDFLSLGTDGVNDATDCHVSVQFTGLEFVGLDFEWPLPNVWLGTSVESADYLHRIDTLKATGAGVLFLSLEPLLGPLPTLGEHLDGIDWVIAGGESGPGARPCHPDWIRSIRDQCQAAGVAFHFKQNGEWLPLASADEASQYPNAPLHTFDNGVQSVRVGKKAAGRLLDGKEWSEFPEDAA